MLGYTFFHGTRNSPYVLYLDVFVDLRSHQMYRDTKHFGLSSSNNGNTY